MTPPAFDPVAALLAAHPGATPEAIIDARVDQLRDDLVALGVSLEPPLDLETCTAALGISVSEMDDPAFGCDGALMEPAPGTFHIILNRASGGRARRRFTLAHELVHTLVPDDPDRPRLRTPRPVAREDGVVERLVDRGAARLLMHPDQFGPDLQAAGLTPDGLLALARRYGASREATAVNAVRASDGAVAIAFVRFAHRPSTRAASLLHERPRWRVERAFHTSSFPAYLHPGLAFADGGVVARAARAECQVVDEERVGRERPLRCRVAARPLGRAGLEPPRVLAVIETDRQDG